MTYQQVLSESIRLRLQPLDFLGSHSHAGNPAQGTDRGR
jgi:hypothetical protein